MKLYGWNMVQNGHILDFFREHQDSKRDIPYAGAQAALEPNGPLEAGTICSFTRVVTAGREGISSGSSVICAFPRSWTRPQTDNPSFPGYVTAESPDRQHAIKLSYAINLEWYIEVLVDEDMDEGDKITVAFNKVRIQNFAQHTWDNWRNNLGVFICRNEYKEIFPLHPGHVDRNLVIVNGPPARLRLMVPVPVEKGEMFALKISVLDRFGNTPCTPFKGTVCFRSDIEITDLPLEVQFEESDANYMEIMELSVPDTGCGFLYAETPSMIQGKSNLLLCEEKVDNRIWFGDIHAHTAVSDGLGTPEDLYQHARFTALSDFGAVTDHNHRENASISEPLNRFISSESWQEIKKAGESNNKEGEFVTLAGVEEAMSGTGHRNIYYSDPPEELFQGASIEELYEYLDASAPDAVVIPHHTLEICKSTDYDPRYISLIEIYSMWGSSEERYGSFWSKNIDRGISVIEILNEGHKLGIIGGSDNHHGKPDISAVPSRFTNMHYPGGVAAVCCEHLSRDDIFTALKTRAVYATTGERIILRFSINGTEMGQIYNPEKGEELNIAVFAGGTADIRRIDIIKNGELFAVHEASGYLEEIAYTDLFDTPAYYYVRLLQTDGAMAWSSPIWVE